ncbi:hypothetical protein ColLi_01987 [Colletotrichum liriopes]|uniref:Uncharacterized protein n=1 Tax=Colletotrichum liriopes TaxID=708192 RepID=A0AA37LNJ3_9PEZI|nr:hypothetical protein ColLi_01987 [Colletotrichum liriopes]
MESDGKPLAYSKKLAATDSAAGGTATRQGVLRCCIAGAADALQSRTPDEPLGTVLGRGNSNV